MSTIYTDHPEVKRIALRAFPQYSGKKFAVQIQKYPISVSSYWEGGSRDYYVFVNLNTLETTNEVPAQSAFDKPIKGADSVNLVPGLACVRHCYFCGKDLGLTIIIHPDNAPKYLPAPVDLTENQKIILAAHAGLKSFARFDAIARKIPGFNQSIYDTIKAELAAKNLLNKAGAITNDGRNAIGDYRI